MAARRDEAINWDEHRRKIFLEHLSPRTTRDSLKEYLDDFQMNACVVPLKEGRNQGYAFVIFHEEQSVDTIMSRRPHTIDGQIVEFYRSVPDQGSLKEKKAVTELIISNLKRGTISKADLEKRFGGYGDIVSAKMDSDYESCVMEFKDYDSVDQILLGRPHNIKGMEIQMKKGNRKNRLENSFVHKTSSTTSNDYKNNISQKRSCLKVVQIDPQASSLSLPDKIYCVHITNLSPHLSGDYLATKFNWPLGDILIDPSTNDQSSTIECWIKRMEDKRMADDFVKKWNGQKLIQSRIECTVEEDELEFCNKFRIGQCPKTDDVCDWDHVVCTAKGSCSNDCRHGHDVGVKTGFRDLGSSITYRIKITGFEQKLTPDYLERVLREKKCFILRSDDSVGYIGPLLTMKYARRLIDKWHNKVIDGQKLQCQIEYNIRSIASTKSSRAGSRSSLASKDNDDRDFERSRPSANSSANNSRESSPGNNSDTGIRVINDVDINYEPRLYQRSVEEVLKQRNTDKKKQAKSADHLSLHTERKSLSGSVNDLTQDSPIATTVRHRNDHGSIGTLIKYPDTSEDSFHRYLDALKLLEGVKGVVQLNKTKEVVESNGQRCSEKNKNTMIIEKLAGLSLADFVQRESRGGFAVLEAIQLVQKLTTIVQEIHSRNVFHQNLGPETIIIDWDPKKSAADEAQLTIQDFSHAYIKSDKKHQLNPSTVQSWYKPPQADAEPLKYIATIDPSSICALLFWLLTNTDPKHTTDTLPHQQENVINKLDNKIALAVRNAKTNLKQPLEELQLKNYLFDTFSIAFGYPQHSPWFINDLQCRLESIHELLSPRNPRLDTTETVFGDLISISHLTRDIPAAITNAPQGAFQKAAMAFQLAKKNFLSLYNHQFFWFDGGCKWVESIEMGENERRHDDVLTYEYQDRARRLSGNFSIIITCIATLADGGNLITLSLGSSVNGKICRIPIGRYSIAQNIAADVQKNFAMELGNLIKSIAKERRLTTSE